MVTSTTTSLRSFTAIAGFALALFASSPALATPCTLLAVDKPTDAKLKIYFTRFPKEDNTGGKYKQCRIVKKAEDGTTTFFVTPFRQDATDVVHESNWPK